MAKRLVLKLFYTNNKPCVEAFCTQNLGDAVPEEHFQLGLNGGDSKGKKMCVSRQ